MLGLGSQQYELQNFFPVCDHDKVSVLVQSAGTTNLCYFSFRLFLVV